MRALKFLACGAVAPFTGVRWPAPDASGAPGAWLEAAGPLQGGGVHACAAVDLAFWLNEELWEVELGGEVVPGPSLLEAQRGRLLRRVEAWSPTAALAYGAACAQRLRERAAAALETEGFAAAAAAFRAAQTPAAAEALPLLPAVAAAPRAADLAAYVAELRVRAGRVMVASFICAVGAAAVEQRPAAFEEERRAQGLLLARLLRLQSL